MLITIKNLFVRQAGTAELGGLGGLQPHPPPIMLGKNFIIISKLLLVNPVTSATGERSFSMTRRVTRNVVACQHETATF